MKFKIYLTWQSFLVISIIVPVWWYHLRICNLTILHIVSICLYIDNRDAGLSSKIEEAGEPDILKIIEALMRGETINPPYTIEDMAADTVGLMDALGIKKAHIC